MDGYWPLRSKSPRKPWPECPDVVIYRCNCCGRLFQALGYGELSEESPFCCNASTKRLSPINVRDIPDDLSLDYKIVGGFNQNAIQVFWETCVPEQRPEWILVQTFTGGYIKYLTSKKKPPMVFPMSDEDAYVYCDRKVCQQCVFRCKNGFIIYIYIKSIGLVELPLDKMSDYFKQNKA